MNIEMKVTNLSISKKLKEIGVNQKSYFSWYAFENPSNRIFKESDLDNDMWRISTTRDASKGGADWVYPAFTASELIDMLPHSVDTKINEPFNNYRFWMTKSFIVEGNELTKRFIYIVNYKCDSTECAGENAWLSRQLTSNIHDENLANALSLMLIFLIENKFMEIPK